MKKYQIGTIGDLDSSDPSFATLKEALGAALLRAHEYDERRVCGIWEMDAPGLPLIALVHVGDVYWQDGYTVRMDEAQP